MKARLVTDVGRPGVDTAKLDSADDEDGWSWFWRENRWQSRRQFGQWKGSTGKQSESVNVVYRIVYEEPIKGNATNFPKRIPRHPPLEVRGVES
jgi:hypothetical protein